MECIRPVIEILTGIGTVIGILTCLWPCCVTHANYFFKLQENGDSLKKALEKLRIARDNVQTVVDDAESNLNEPMKRRDQVNKWLQSVTEIESEVLEILQQLQSVTEIEREVDGILPQLQSVTEIEREVDGILPQPQSVTEIEREVLEILRQLQSVTEIEREVDGILPQLQSVTEIEREVDGILPQVDQQTSRRCLGGCCPNCCSDYMLGRSIVQKIASLDELREEAGRFEEPTNKTVVAYKLPPPLVQPEPTKKTVGMKSMIDMVWRLLAEDKVEIMGLYGQGGVGKTTLLKQINNKFFQSTSSSNNNNTHGFDIVILVVVSKVINIDAIQKVIGSRLRLSSTDKTSIFNALSKKRFLLLLDDIWERVELQSIGIPPPDENNKSKVIFTTRSENVCAHMDANIKFRVKCLSWDEAWTLFQERVGYETLNSHPKVPELAKIVAKECGGLPLALITIGRAMSSKKTVQEWKHAITTLRKSASEFPGMSDQVLPLLNLSYDHLGDAMIKSCFLYCALFPEDESINLPNLIDYWIGEGLISLNEFDHIDDARNKGYDVIGILKGACLLENVKNKDDVVKMHDTIRDLALWIAHDCESKRDKMLIIKRSDLTAETSSWYNAERICLSFIYNGKDDVPVPLSTQNSPNLLTLIPDWATLCTLLIPQNFFSFMPLLRVLDLSNSLIETFPTGITDLLELRYLSLSVTHIEVLPRDLGKLVKLNFLDLSLNRSLKKIPSGVIGSLLELRVLNLYACPRADWDFDEVYKLKHLNDLRITINTQHNLNKLLSNQSLQMCTRRLHLSSSSPSPSASSSTTTLGGVGNMKSLEKLELLSNLELLRLDSFPELLELSYYMPQEAAPFQNLGDIIIQHCNALKDLTWVGYVVNLKLLYVSHCEELEEISMVMNNVKDVFKRLKSLNILHLPKLKSICRNALAFPCLELMYVRSCPKLKKLPFDSGSNLNNTLKLIDGEEEWWNELRWEDDHDSNELLKKFQSYFKQFITFDLQ